MGHRVRMENRVLKVQKEKMGNKDLRVIPGSVDHLDRKVCLAHAVAPVHQAPRENKEPKVR